MALPPILAHTSPSIYHAVFPSIVFWHGTLFFNVGGTRDVHKSGGSVQWASQSTIFMPARGPMSPSLFFVCKILRPRGTTVLATASACHAPSATRCRDG